MNFIKYIGEQFANPKGFGGKFSTFLMNRMNQAQYKSVEKCFPNTTVNTVLDIGYGNGYLLYRFASKHSAVLYGVDISNDMLVLATKRNEPFIKSKKMFLRLGDVMRLPYNNDFFDFCYTVNTVYFWENPLAGFGEIRRVLNQGGTFANVFYSKKWLDKLQYTKYDFIKYAPSELAAIAEQAGFLNVQIHEIKRDCSYLLTMEK